MSPKLRGAPPDDETEIQRFMREMREQDDERNLAFQDQVAASEATQAAQRATHAVEVAALRAQLERVLGEPRAPAEPTSPRARAPSSPRSAGDSRAGSPAAGRPASPTPSTASTTARAAGGVNPFSAMPVKAVSRNYQNFQRKTVELAFSGTSKDKVLDWL